MSSEEGAILTLEPLIEAVRGAVEAGGWTLSGLQKTTSHEFGGRWEGDTTRSAYLFFHGPDGTEHASVDVYLDETSRGLTGNLALVVDLRDLAELGDARALLARLGEMAAPLLPERHRRPVTLRFRMEDATAEPGEAEAEVRFKVVIPRATIAKGSDAVSALASASLASFERILARPELTELADRG